MPYRSRGILCQDFLNLQRVKVRVSGHPAILYEEFDEPTEHQDQEAVEQQEKYFVQQLLGNDFVIR